MSPSPADPACPEEPALAPFVACPLFSALPKQVLREFAARARVRRYAAGEALFRNGDVSDSAFVIRSGHVQAMIRSSEGRELVLGVAGPGESPGYTDLLDESPRCVDAMAEDDVEALVLPARVVRLALIEHPGALLEVSVGLASIIRELDQLARDLVFLDLPARLAKLLLARAPCQRRVELGFTQSELAAQLGVARQSLNRTLGDLQRRELIRVEDSGRSVELLDRTALERMAVGAGQGLSPM